MVSLPYINKNNFTELRSLEITLIEQWQDLWSTIEFFEELILWWRVVPYKDIVMRTCVIKKKTVKGLDNTKNQNVQKILQQLKFTADPKVFMKLNPETENNLKFKKRYLKVRCLAKFLVNHKTLCQHFLRRHLWNGPEGLDGLIPLVNLYWLSVQAVDSDSVTTVWTQTRCLTSLSHSFLACKIPIGSSQVSGDLRTWGMYEKP